MISQEYAKTFKKVVDLPIINDITIKKILCLNGINYWWPLSWGIFHDLCKSSSLHVIRNIGLIYRKMDRIFPIDWFISYIQRQLYGFSGSNKRIDGNNIKIIVLDVDSSWKLVPTSTPGKSIYYNTYHGDITDAIKKQKNVILYSFCFRMNIFRQTPLKIKELKRKSADIRIMSNYYTLSMWNEKRKSGIYFKKIYKLICDNPNWIHQWGVVSEKSDETVKSIFRYYLLIVLPELVGFATLFNTIIRKEKPDLFFQSWEHADYRRVATVVAEKNNVPTVALQHGVNYPTSLDYTYHDQTSVQITDIYNEFPISEKTCVWGEYDSNILTTYGNYSPKNIAICGCPRYDSMLDVYNNRNVFLDAHPLLKNKTIILWATSSDQYTVDENIINTREIIAALAGRKDIILLIKQHPGETKDQLKILIDRLSESKITYNVIDISENITPYIAICDLLIHHGSTCGQEAIIFNKPMIVLELSENIINGGYEEEKTGVIIRKPGCLKQCINDMLACPSKFQKEYEHYIQKYLYKVDGKSSERIAQLILNLIKDRKSSSI